MGRSKTSGEMGVTRDRDATGGVVSVTEGLQWILTLLAATSPPSGKRAGAGLKIPTVGREAYPGVRGFKIPSEASLPNSPYQRMQQAAVWH